MSEASGPLWSRVLDDLRRRLAEGEFEARFPTDREIVSEYGVSRHTAREAVRRLTADGLVERTRGRGSFLRGPQFEQPLGTLYSLFRSIEATGAVQTSEVVSLERVRDADAASVLGLRSSDGLVRLERVRLADQEPIAVDVVWLPERIGAPLLDCDFGHTALYDELARRSGTVIDAARERIRPIVPAAPLARRLGLARGEAAFDIERVGSSRGTVVEWRSTVLRGDRFTFVAEWSPADHATQLTAEPRIPAARRSHRRTAQHRASQRNTEPPLEPEASSGTSPGARP